MLINMSVVKRNVVRAIHVPVICYKYYLAILCISVKVAL